METRIYLLICIVLGICIFLPASDTQYRNNVQQSINLSSDLKTIEPEITEPDTGNIVVKGLVLKYVLLDTAYEMYEVNVLKNRSYENYSRMGEDTKNHYKWLTDTYNSMNEENKTYLKELFGSGLHPWYLMNLTTRLDDSSNVDDIIWILTSDVKVINAKLKAPITSFLPYFYSHFLKTYIEANDEIFNTYVSKLNNEIQEKNPDIIGFMESVSGIRFKTKYKAMFYYTLRPIGAMGFSYKGSYTSTIQRTITDYSYLFGAPFHEFSHELFQTFTRDKEFIEAAALLKSNDALMDKWLNSMKSHYQWEGWCEENLVEGFAKYLFYKYYNKDGFKSIYIYDYDFYKLLKEKNFDGRNHSLKEISIEFIKGISQQ